MAQHQGHGEDRGARVGNPLPGDIRGRTVHGLEHGGVVVGRVDIARGGQADAAGHRARQVGQNVSEEVIGDDDVVAGWVGDYVDGRGVDVVVVHLDVREFLTDRLDGTLPQATGVDEDIGLVDPGQLFAALLGAAEGVADDALNAEPGVLADLAGDLVVGAFAQGAAVAAVEALSTFADDHEVDLAGVL